MSTQTKSRRARSSSTGISVVKVIRSALRRSISLEAGLVDRRLAARERLDLLGEDVAGDHLVAELGEAGGGHQTDPADPDYPDRLALLAHSADPPSFVLCFRFGSITLADRAMPSICSPVKPCCRLFDTQ